MDFEITNNNESMSMDHGHAARIQACTRYLAGGLSAEESEAFEEHYFGCQECAEELRLGEAFVESLRTVFNEESRHAAAQGISTRLAGPTWLERLRMSFATFAVPVTAVAGVILSVMIYQNMLLIPRLRTEVATLSEPQTVPAVPLKLARGDESVQLPKSPYWMPYFFLPKSGQFSSYFCDIETSAGTKLKTVSLPAPAPGQPFAILLRRSEYPGGAYVFKIRGNSNDNKILAKYSLTLKDN